MSKSFFFFSKRNLKFNSFYAMPKECMEILWAGTMCSQYSTQATLYVHTIQSNFYITDLCKIYLLYLGIVLSVLKSNQPAPFDVTSCIKWQRLFQKQPKSSQHTTVQPLDVTWPILLTTISHEDVWTAQVAITNCQNDTRSKHTPFNWTSCAGSTGLKRFP